MSCNCKTSCNCEPEKPVNHCPSNTVTHIAKVGNSIAVTMSDCIFYKTMPSKIDLVSFKNILKVVVNIKIVDNIIRYTVHDVVTGEESILEVTLPAASESVAGVVKLATDMDAIEGVSNTAVLTPKTALKMLQNVSKNATNLPKATDTKFGVSKFATGLESLDFNNNSVALTPLTAKVVVDKLITDVLNNKTATETETGLVKLGCEILDNDGVTVLGYLISKD